MTVKTGKISEFAFKVVISVLFGITISIAIFRTFFRMRTQKHVQLDDAFVLFAYVSFVVGTIILYKTFHAAYSFQWAQLNYDLEFIPDFAIGEIEWFQRMEYAYLSVTWITIYSVKFSFLCFFKMLVNRLPTMMIYWRTVVAFTSITLCFSFAEIYFSCPKFGIATLQCNHSKNLHLQMRLDTFSNSLDILTDVLIVTIPICLLWNLHVKRRQKIGVGAFLCLSVLMAIIASIRVSRLNIYGTYDFTWLIFWLQFEACVAVLTVSLTAFPAIFTTEGSKGGLKNAKLRYPSILQRFKRHHPNEPDLPAYPGVAVGGSRSGTRGGPRTKWNDDDKFSDDWPLQEYDMPDAYFIQKSSNV